jgi:hypothetical protein
MSQSVHFLCTLAYSGILSLCMCKGRLTFNHHFSLVHPCKLAQGNVKSTKSKKSHGSSFGSLPFIPFCCDTFTDPPSVPPQTGTGLLPTESFIFYPKNLHRIPHATNQTAISWSVKGKMLNTRMKLLCYSTRKQYWTTTNSSWRTYP